MSYLARRHAFCLLGALCACTDEGTVGVLCEPEGCDAARPDSVDARTPTEAGLHDASPQDASPESDAAAASECMQRYAQCTVERLPTFRQDECVPDGVQCGAVSREEGARLLCSTRFTRCLQDGAAALQECQRRFEACSLDPWSDAGA